MSLRVDHDEIESLLAVRALGGADAKDERRLQAAMGDHAPCETCESLETGTNETAGVLAFALPPRAPSSALEERVFGAALAERRGRPPRPRRPSRVAVAFAAAAVAIVAFAAGWLVRGSTSVPLSGLANARVASLDASTGSMTLAYRPGARGALLFGSHVAAPASGHVYELWLIRDGTPIRQGCFAPTSSGAVMLVLDGSVQASDTAAVTVESPACPSAPTTKPIVATQLS